MDFLGDADTSAPHGRAGVVLLDPTDIVVASTGSSSLDASQISASSLTQMLRRGSNVVLLADNRITVQSAIDGRAVGGGTTPSGSVTMTAGTILIEAPVITNNAAIALNATAGDITITGNGSALMSLTAPAPWVPVRSHWMPAATSTIRDS